MDKIYKGRSGTLYLTDTGVRITRPFLRSMFMRPGGSQSFSYDDIVSIQLKRPAFTVGYIQFTLQGGSELHGGVFEALKDENAVTFIAGSLKQFEEAKRLAEERMPARPSTTNGLDDLEKLAALKDKGIITQEEFDLKKKSLLGI